MKNLKKKLMLVIMASGMGIGFSSSMANEDLQTQASEGPYLCYSCQHDSDGYDCKWRVCND